jgi:hypothetical protein
MSKYLRLYFLLRICDLNYASNCYFSCACHSCRSLGVLDKRVRIC